MGDRRLLQAALAAPQHRAAGAQAERHFDDIDELLRLLPLPSTVKSLIATALLGAAAVSVWLLAIWIWLPTARSWLLQYGFYELGLITLALVVLQHVPPVGRWLARRLPGSPLPPAIETMTFYSVWRMYLLVPMLMWLHLRTFALDIAHDRPNSAGRNSAEWVAIVILASVVMITNWFVPQFIARWRGGGLVYPTPQQMKWHRLVWSAVYLFAPLTLAALAWFLSRGM
jgi:hypothetical protein